LISYNYLGWMEMDSAATVTFTVPATTANLGSGFDCIGLALAMYNQFTFTRLTDSTAPPVTIKVSGTEAERVETNENNLVYQSFAKFYDRLGQIPPPVAIEIKLGIPLARGLGSSATAIAGGLVGANLLAGKPLDAPEVIKLAIALEGHPDNIVPALLGGCLLSASNGADWSICEVPWHSNIVPVIAIPDFELSTQEARRVLPTEYSRADAIFNIAHFGLLLRGLETGKPEWIATALQDKIHQPYRKVLIPGYDTVEAAARKAGAYGMVISGAGPTLLALAPAAAAEKVAQAMEKAWQTVGIGATAQAIAIDNQGTGNFKN
jgi:homoserine kinase